MSPVAFNRPGADCRRLRQSLTMAVDGGPIDLALRRHVRDCAPCRRRLAEQRRLTDMLRVLKPVVPIPPRVNRRVRTAKRLASGASGLGIASMAALAVRLARKRP